MENGRIALHLIKLKIKKIRIQRTKILKKLFQETKSRWSVFFFFERSAKYRNFGNIGTEAKVKLFLNFPLKFDKSTEEKRKQDGKDVPKYVLGGEEWWKRQAGNNEGKKWEKRRREGK